MGVATIGVFALLFVCEYLANLVFNRNVCNVGGVAASLGSLFKYVSYASMTCYMFHRFFFWAGEIIWNPSIVWLKWFFMAGLVFPVMIVISYCIQYGYDFLVDRFENVPINRKIK